MGSAYQWEVFLPERDLPAELETDYIPGAGEQITVAGKLWVVETVEMGDEDGEPGSGRVYVTAPSEPVV